MRVVDDVVLATLRSTGVDVFDGGAHVDPLSLPELMAGTKRTVTYDLPYLVYYSSIGDVTQRMMSGRRIRQAVYFSITFVGIDRNQAKWAGEAARAVLEGQRLDIPGYRSWLCSLDSSMRVFRDDDAIRPDGSPLFYGTDDYAVSVALKPTGV